MELCKNRVKSVVTNIAKKILKFEEGKNCKVVG